MSLTAENKEKYLRTYLKTNAAVGDERLVPCLHGYAVVFLSMLSIFKHTKHAAEQVIYVEPVHFCIYHLTYSAWHYTQTSPITASHKELKESTDYFWGLLGWISIKHTFHSQLYRLAYIYISCSEITGNEHQPQSSVLTQARSRAEISKGSKVPVSLVTLCVFTCQCNANE